LLVQHLMYECGIGISDFEGDELAQLTEALRSRVQLFTETFAAKIDLEGRTAPFAGPWVQLIEPYSPLLATHAISLPDFLILSGLAVNFYREQAAAALDEGRAKVDVSLPSALDAYVSAVNGGDGLIRLKEAAADFFKRWTRTDTDDGNRRPRPRFSIDLAEVGKKHSFTDDEGSDAEECGAGPSGVAGAE